MSMSSLRLITVVVVTVALLPQGCGIPPAIRQTNVELRNAIDEFDRAISALTQQSSDWQVVLQNLEADIAADVQSTLRTEVRNLAENTVSATGVEFRCDAEFLRMRAERELRRIRNELAVLLNATGVTPIPIQPEIPPEPYICAAVPTAVNLALEAERRTVLDVYGFDLKSASITAVIVEVGERRNVTSALGIISDMHMVLDLTETGANPIGKSRQIVFSWNGESQSVIPILSPNTQVTCAVQPQRVDAHTQSFVPDHSDGDKDFDGNGPCVKLQLWVKINEDGTELYSTYYMKAFECDGSFDNPESDYTTARANGRVTLFRVVNPGDRILGFDVDPYMKVEYIDTDHEDDIVFTSGTQPTEKLIFVGDTDGDEAGTRTGVEIHFRQINVQVERCTL